MRMKASEQFKMALNQFNSLKPEYLYCHQTVSIVTRPLLRQQCYRFAQQCNSAVTIDAEL
jgi:hypothetical protein